MYSFLSFFQSILLHSRRSFFVFTFFSYRKDAKISRLVRSKSTEMKQKLNQLKVISLLPFKLTDYMTNFLDWNPILTFILQKIPKVGSFPAFVLTSPASVIGIQETYHNSLVTISRLNRLLITPDHHVRKHSSEIFNRSRTP